jgi:DNA-binding CsgD family transcriptional regulator/tetratricopeptide (TPR) repeat protein
MPSRSPLVGRERELETLGRLLERALTGRGSVAVIEGEPGIGKTRLLEETLKTARARGFEVLVGTGEELERDRPFGPVAGALGLTLGASDPRRAGIARLLMSSHDATGAWERGPALRYQVLESILGLVEDLSAARPVVLGLDDVQWADASTLLVVRHLGFRLASLPVVLLIVSRPTHRTGELAAVVEGLREQGLVEVGLGPLSGDEVAELAASMTRRTPSPGFLAQLSGAAGNPLLVTEYISAVQDAGPRPGDQMEVGTRIDVPPTFADAVLRRLRYLSGDALHVLKLASVLGTVFSVADLALVVGRPATDLLPALDEGRTAGLLVEVVDRLAFRHDLVRDAVYTDLPVAIRRELHAHAGRALGSAGRSAAQVAAQVTLGATPGDQEAIRWLHTAANESIELDPAMAADLLERARELAGPVSVSPELLMDLLRAYVWSGRVTDAESLGRQLLGAEGGAYHSDLVRLFLARALISQGRGPEGLAMLEPVLLDGGITRGPRTALFTTGAILRVMVGDAEGARALGERGVRVAKEGGSAGDEALNLAYLGMADRAAGDPRHALELAIRAIDVAARARTRVPQFVPVYNLAGRLFMDADRMEEADSALQAGRRLTEEHGFVWGEAECHALLAERLLHMGEWDDSIAEAETAVDLCGIFGAWHAFGAAKSILALVATRRNALQRAKGDVGAARDRLTSAAGQFGRPWVRWATGLLREAEGDPRDALRSFVEAWRDSEGIVSEEATIGPDLVRLAVNLGERRLAIEVAATLETGKGRAALPRIDGAAMLCRGLVDDDVDALVASVGAYRAVARPYELARACEATGASLGRGASQEDCIALFRESIEIYERLRATRDVARIEASLRALGVRRGRRIARGRPETGWESLTPTESSVVQLVAEGLRNGDIADRLFVSRRTVETHLTHVFGKLAISSRTELVAMAGRQQP